MSQRYRPSYIKCPDCNNVLDLLFISKSCPNPLCDFNFNGLEQFLHEDEGKLRDLLQSNAMSRDSREYKLIRTAVKFNMFSYLTHFIECSWGAHYQTLFKEFIIRNLDDLNTLKEVLRSCYIREDKQNTTTSKNGYKMFWSLYCYLMKVYNMEIIGFLQKEFPDMHRKHYRLLHQKHIRRTHTQKALL